MYQIKDKTIKISVRNLVEFILRSGDLDNRSGGGRTDAMQEGSKVHRMIQKQMGSEYSAEIPLVITVPLKDGENQFLLQIDGRADGIIQNRAAADNPEEPEVIVDEIKGVYSDLEFINEPVGVHKAQVMCYAYIYGEQHKKTKMGIRITYCNMDTKAIKYFEETISFEEMERWFNDLTNEYARWAIWQYHWIEKRNTSIKGLVFPFPYREGQRELTTGVYKTIIRDKKLFIEAPTGVGKTISTVFPGVKAMGEGFTSKIFYLTAKTITRTVAEETFRLLKEQGLYMKIVTITAKDKICILEKSDCNPIACERAKGHYDRVNNSVFDLLVNEQDISRDSIIKYAEKHQVCPFEMCLDVTTWADCIICDYNYAFDPNIYLKRFFVNEKKNDYIFLIDEAHNLVERAREMYSAVLYKEQFLQIKHIVASKSKKLGTRLEICNKDLLKLKRECDDFKIQENVSDFILHLMTLLGEYEEFMKEHRTLDEKERIVLFYLEIRHFLNMYEVLDEKYVIYTDHDDKEGFRIKLQCMNPSSNLLTCLDKGRSAIFFSATLLPIKYYREQLGGKTEDYAIYAPSPFEKKNRAILIAGDVSTKYTRRNNAEFNKILNYILEFTGAKPGNYMVFFPSYQFMNQILELMGDENDIVVQSSNMSEAQKEEFLSSFTENPEKSRTGFCVMGGVFSEGIDLKRDRLIGAVIVGTGLPMVCNERELFRDYYEEKNGTGFDYAYLYPGINKVLQSAGRVIRTAEDKGAVLLLDDRFQNSQYYNLFPREWFPNTLVNRKTLKGVLEEFWDTDN